MSVCAILVAFWAVCGVLPVFRVGRGKTAGQGLAGPFGQVLVKTAGRGLAGSVCGVLVRFRGHDKTGPDTPVCPLPHTPGT